MRRWSSVGFRTLERPLAMPEIPAADGPGASICTSAVTEPFSFVDGNQAVVGLDVEIARRVAQRLAPDVSRW
jgi:polar amino acid transport system substrate-binding protein